jgi:hypothetical protein
MKRSSALSGRLREVLLNGRWIANTNCREQLLKTDWIQATQQVANLNTIASLTYHINYYLAGLLNALENNKLDISDKYSFDLPPLNSEQDWNKLVQQFIDNSERFATKVEQLGDAELEEPFIDPKYGAVDRNIEAIIEHSYYHLGQISLIRKLVEQAADARGETMSSSSNN